MGYDEKGNLTSGVGWTYDYDAQNRLTTMQGAGMTITLTYDPLNRVVTRNVNGAVTQNVWDGWNLIEEHRPDCSIQRCYLQGGNQNEMVAAFDGNVHTNHWYWQDGRGNTSHITGDPGNLLERYTYDLSGAPKFYDEWGSERWGGSVYDTRFLFAGSQYLPDTGLYDMRNRFYHITLNRFLQTDPIGFQGDSLNLYRYCHNDPADFSDPLGLDFTAEIMLRENLENIPNIRPLHYGGTTGTLKVRAGVINNRIVFDDVDIRATSYVRTRMKISNPFLTYEYNRSRQDIARTIGNEGQHLEHHESYYRDYKQAIRRDFEDNKTYTTKKAADDAIAAKEKVWQENYRADYLRRGKELHRRSSHFESDTSTKGNQQVPSGTSGAWGSSAAAVDAAIGSLPGVGGPEAGEGFHPPGAAK
jgi:RHS repeat-associated protein